MVGRLGKIKRELSEWKMKEDTKPEEERGSDGRVGVSPPLLMCLPGAMNF